jgi:hypothetical protein
VLDAALRPSRIEPTTSRYGQQQSPWTQARTTIIRGRVEPITLGRLGVVEGERDAAMQHSRQRETRQRGKQKENGEKQKEKEKEIPKLAFGLLYPNLRINEKRTDGCEREETKEDGTGGRGRGRNESFGRERKEGRRKKKNNKNNK